ncbi:hypothetical protein AMK18_15475 [Streptomyces sp. CB01249]|uniref:CHAT domain-containing protein n=1 Tax=Streptomyces sp. CB01249 TaxID=1703929 RepID=UPI00093B1EAE|nr:CHAT domain-containing protein [Streptomyces sp. CB01249]OKJ00076.1 hypothetical protein AMK18_15475 [Streptomyces sp. CB01249]
MTAAVCLVLAASPEAGRAPALHEEHRDVQRSVTHARFGHLLRLDVLPAARAEDLVQYLAATVPHTLHFAGRGTPDGGPRFVTDDGGEAPVSLDGLRDCVADAAPLGLRLVVLNACWTEPLAKEMAGLVPVAIGWEGQVPDAHACAYARVFYRNLAEGDSVLSAHATACKLLALIGCTELPVLHSTPGHLPEAHFLIAAADRPVPPGKPLKPRWYRPPGPPRKPWFPRPPQA